MPADPPGVSADGLDEMVRAGHRRFRLPNWNEHAYIEPDVLADGRVGPWTTLHDVTGDQRILTLHCDQQRGWEPLGSGEIERPEATT